MDAHGRILASRYAGLNQTSEERPGSVTANGLVAKFLRRGFFGPTLGRFRKRKAPCNEPTSGTSSGPGSTLLVSLRCVPMHFAALRLLELRVATVLSRREHWFKSRRGHQYAINKIGWNMPS